MKRLEKLLYHTCTFGVLIYLLFVVFTLITTGKNEISVDASTFFVILLFSLIISITNMIFEVNVLKIYIKLPVHFAVLFVAFYIIFANKGTLAVDSAADFMVVFCIFAFFYALFSAIAILVIKSVRRLDTKLPEKKAKSTEKSDYSPRFK